MNSEAFPTMTNGVLFSFDILTCIFNMDDTIKISIHLWFITSIHGILMDSEWWISKLMVDVKLSIPPMIFGRVQIECTACNSTLIMSFCTGAEVVADVGKMELRSTRPKSKVTMHNI